jgi:uncharacterized membrane protein YgcG
VQCPMTSRKRTRLLIICLLNSHLWLTRLELLLSLPAAIVAAAVAGLRLKLINGCVFIISVLVMLLVGTYAWVYTWCCQFNLETPDSDIFKDHLRIYRVVSSSLPPSPSQPTTRPQPSPSPPPPLPPFELQVLLSIPELTSNQVLVYQAGSGTDSSPRVRMEPTPRFILLESWVLVFNPSPASSSSSASAASSSSSGGYRYGEGDSASTSASSSTSTSIGGGGAGGEVAPSTIYKHGITLFRSLFSLLRILPAWKLFKRLRRGNRSAGLGIRLRVRGVEGDHIHEHGILGFGKSMLNIYPTSYIYTNIRAQ